MSAEAEPISKAQLKRYRALTRKRFRREQGRFLAEGLRLVEEALRSTWGVEALLVGRGAGEQALDHLRPLMAKKHDSVSTFLVEPSDWRDVCDTVHSQGVMAVVRGHQFEKQDALSGQSSLLVALDGLSDPGNVGTIIRTADWFGADAVLLSKGCVELFNPKVVRSTMGSIFHLPVLEEVDLSSCLRSLRAEGLRTLAADTKGNVSCDELAPARSVLVLGSEDKGLAPEVLAEVDETVRIPGRGSAESLNVAIAAGILLEHLASN